jgi:hypothetical protein
MASEASTFRLEQDDFYLESSFRSGLLLRMIFSENRVARRIKSEAGFFGIMPFML